MYRDENVRRSRKFYDKLWLSARYHYYHFYFFIRNESFLRVFWSGNVPCTRRELRDSPAVLTRVPVTTFRERQTFHRETPKYQNRLRRSYCQFQWIIVVDRECCEPCQLYLKKKKKLLFDEPVNETIRCCSIVRF